MTGIRSFLTTSAGRAAACVAAVVAIGALFLSVRANLGRSDAASISGERAFICAETGKEFDHTLARGETVPVKSPYSGRATGYPAELCYWTADGKTKDKPTPVLLNEYKGSKEPTFCPDCGRLVVGHNPFPQAGKPPPPTKQEYAARGGRAATANRPRRGVYEGE